MPAPIHMHGPDRRFITRLFRYFSRWELHVWMEVHLRYHIAMPERAAPPAVLDAPHVYMCCGSTFSDEIPFPDPKSHKVPNPPAYAVLECESIIFHTEIWAWVRGYTTIITILEGSLLDLEDLWLVRYYADRFCTRLSPPPSLPAFNWSWHILYIQVVLIAYWMRWEHVALGHWSLPIARP